MSVVERFPLEHQVAGQKVSHEGETYEVVGINTRRTRHPITVRRLSDGKEFAFPWEVVRDQVTF